METAKIIESLVASGPMTLVMGFAVLTLWKDLKNEREEKDKLNKEMVKLVKDLTRAVNGEADE